MRAVHSRGCYCVLNCGARGHAHHVLLRGQGGDDDVANLVCLCHEHHRLLHTEDRCVRMMLGEHLVLERHDTIAYLEGKLGKEAAWAWLARRLLVM